MQAGSETIGVIGAGQMGAGIAQVAATAGYDVVLVDVDEATLERARGTIQRSLDRLVRKERITASDAEAALARMRTTTERTAVASATLVVEAVPEDEALKKTIFADLDRICGPDAVLASNTSSISITRLATATNRPERVVGMHFMNPVPVMKLVEVVRGLHTSDATCARVVAVAERMGKTTVQAQDSPGFAVNRILMPMINEAIFALQEGVASAADIDTAMKLGTNQPMGPLALADLIGLDTCLAILEVLHAGLGDPKYRPCPLLRRYVDAGWLGRKTGRGFHVYGE